MLGLMDTLLAAGFILLLFAFVAFVVFLIFREFFTWYWKQTEQSLLLRDIRDSLRRLEEQGTPVPALVEREPGSVTG